MARKQTQKYFFSFVYREIGTPEWSFSFGWLPVTVTGPVNVQTLDTVAAEIKKTKNAEAVTILNWRSMDE